MQTELPRILSPNLGCPIIVSPKELNENGIDVVVAEEGTDSHGQFSLIVHPSFPGEGKKFSLKLEERKELIDRLLPHAFERVEDTRFLISTTLASSIFEDKARFFRYQGKPVHSIDVDVLRTVDHAPRATLYDLILMQNERCIGTVFHSLYLHPTSGSKDDRLRFIHLTDLHVALRNDLYENSLRDTVSYQDDTAVSHTDYNNFNENLRRFIRYANMLADKGELDFVLMLGDLVDFLRHGFTDKEVHGDNNFRTFCDIILGTAGEKHRGQQNPGLKVPIYTSTGNHDWRFFPYDAALKNKIYGVDKKTAEQFDLFWADEQEEITRKCETFYSNLIRKGSPVSNRTLFGKIINKVLPFLEKWEVKLATPLSTSVVTAFLTKIPAVGKFLQLYLGTHYTLFASAIALLAIPMIGATISGCIKYYVRKYMVFGLIAIEAGWRALKDYFLMINPYFNYAFRLGRNYFLVLDTGHDCLRAQYLWDDGDKKLGPLSIRDNTIGGSPDTMAFYDVNEYYPYSQISWIDRLQDLITRNKEKDNEPVRIIIGLHTPPINLSQNERKKADKLVTKDTKGLLLAEGKFDIGYGSTNHFLSQFLHLCLGRVEQYPGTLWYNHVDFVLAGHAHWKLEFRLDWNHKLNKPVVYYGDFTSDLANYPQNCPLFLQTPSAGPKEEYSPNPPYFRMIEIDGQGKVKNAAVFALEVDGTPSPYSL